MHNDADSLQVAAASARTPHTNCMTRAPWTEGLPWSERRVRKHSTSKTGTVANGFESFSQMTAISPVWFPAFRFIQLHFALLLSQHQLNKVAEFFSCLTKKRCIWAFWVFWYLASSQSWRSSEGERIDPNPEYKTDLLVTPRVIFQRLPFIGHEDFWGVFSKTWVRCSIANIDPPPPFFFFFVGSIYLCRIP